MTKYDDRKIMVGLSGGINSMAVLCWLVSQGAKPKELHLYYAHFAEHSPDTFQFVADGIRYARKHFDNVIVKITNNSVLRFFEGKGMIPHPTYSPCSDILKIIPMTEYCYNNGIEIDLIGYVRKEKKRINRMLANGACTLFITKEFPIDLFDDEWCFQIVKHQIGWYPAIYDIRDENGKRIFSHNNCLPCKNMYVKNMKMVEKYYPSYMLAAKGLSDRLQKYWGRNADEYYTTFGREDYEQLQCEVCAFD